MDNERKDIVARWVIYHTRGQTELLSTKAFEVYSKLLCRVAAADGVLAPAERRWIIGQRAALGAPDELLDMLKTYEPSNDDWKLLLQKQRSFVELAKNVLIYDAFQAAAADSELHKKERDAITELGQELGVDQSTIEKIAQLHNDEVEIKKRRLALLFPKGNVDETIRKSKQLLE